MGVALDSSFLVDLIRGSAPALEKLREIEESGELPSIPAPALYELAAGALIRKGRSTARRVEGLLSRCPCLPLDRESAVRAAEVRAELAGLGREKPHVDVLIAGIALRNSVALVTRDRDFRAIAQATGLELSLY